MHRALRTALVLLTLAFAAPLGAQPAAAPGLAPLPAPAQVAAFGAIRVERFGNADGATPVVLLPDLGAGPWEWAALIPRLSPARGVYAVSLPGTDGLDTAAPPLFPRVEADIQTMLARLNVDHPVLIGHGLGGMIALALAEEQPDRFAAVVAVDASPVLPGTENDDYATRRAKAAAAAAVRRTPAQFLAFAKKTASSDAIDAANADAIAAHLAQTAPGAFAQWSSEELAFDARPTLARIAVPIVAVAPTDTFQHDAADETQRKALVTKRFAGARSFTADVLGPARSFIMIDQPDAFASVVDTLLRALP